MKFFIGCLARKVFREYVWERYSSGSGGFFYQTRQEVVDHPQ